MPEVDNHLKPIFLDESRYEYSYGLDLMRLAENLQATKEKEVLILLGRIMSLGYNNENESNPFFSHTDIHSDEKSSYVTRRHFEDEYFNAVELDNLIKILPCIQYPILTSRVADLLWTLKRNHLHAIKAIEAYKQCSESTFDTDSWVDCFGYLKKAARIARSLGKNNQHFKDFCAYIDSIIHNINGTDPLFLSINLIELQLKSGYRKLADYLGVVDKIINDALIKTSLHRVETAFELKIKLLHKLGDNEAKLATQIAYAQYVERLAQEHQEKGELVDTQRAIMLFEEAVLLYRHANLTDDSNRIRRVLEPLKRTYAESMPSISQTIDRKSTFDRLNILMAHHSLLEQITILSLLTTFRSKSDLEESVLSKHREFLFSSMFSKVLLDSDGKAILHLPPLDMKNPKSDMELLEKHMHREATTLHNFDAIILLDVVFHIVRETHERINLEDMDFLIDDNFLVPDDRKHIFKLGIMHGLNGDYYAALHLLVPQVENLFREITSMCGGLITTFEDDATEQLKVLSSIFDSAELQECYDENVLFIFKGLLNEKAGANLRNRVAHGVADSTEGHSTLAKHFLAAVIKLCSWYSIPCLKIMPVLRRKLEGTDTVQSTAE